MANDDFGTGYSSLACLRKFPDRQIWIDMARDISRQVVTEVVEKHETRFLLKQQAMSRRVFIIAGRWPG